MANHSIKIKGVADFSAISKEVDDLHKTIDDAFGKKGMQVLDKTSVSFLKKETENAFNKMSNQLKKLKTEAKELEKALSTIGKDDKKSEELSKKRLANLQMTVAAEKSLAQLRKSENRMEGGPDDNVIPFPKSKGSFAGMAGKQLTGGALGVAHDLPGLSQAATVGESAYSAGSAASAAGLGAAAIAGLAVLGAAAAGAAIAISRMAAGFETYKQSIPTLLTLSGQGITPAKDNRSLSGAAQLGYGPQEVFETQKQLSSAFGKAPDQRSDSNRILNTMTASRDLGISPGQVSGAGESLRQLGGTEMAQKQVGMILEKAITSGMDKSQSSAFLSAAVGLLSELNQSGVTNSSQLLGVMSGLVSKNGMSPEMAAKSIGGLSSAVSGSSGESNAFFQSAAARGGLGGGTLMGTQFAVRQGLAGVDMGALQKQVGDTKSGQMGIQSISEMGLGTKDFSQRFASSIMDEIHSRFDTQTKEGRQAALGFTGQMFGAKTAPEAAKTLSILEKIANGGDMNTDEKKLLEDLNKDPDAAWREKTLGKLDAIALSTAATAAFADKAKFELGEASATLFNDMTAALTKLDVTLAGKVPETTKTLESGANSLGSAMGAGLDGVKELPGKVWDGIKEAIVGKGPVQMMFDAASSGVKSLFGSAATDGPIGSPSSSAPAGQAESPSDSIQHELLQESKKQTGLLEKALKPGMAPRAGRIPSR